MFMDLRKLVLLACLAVCTCGCGDFRFGGPDRGEQLARVGKSVLYSKDIESIFPAGMAPEDSVALLRSYVNRWAMDKLKLKQAEEQFSSKQNDIERMVNDYRTSLLLYKYDVSFVDSRIDTVIGQSEMAAFYDEHKADFTLQSPIVKAKVVRMGQKFNQEKKIKELIRSQDSDDHQTLIDLCEKNGLKMDEFNAWVDMSSIAQHIPLPNRDFDAFIRDNRFYEVEDQDYVYVMYITSYKLSGEVSPIDNEQAAIRKMIINKRKAELVKHLEDSLMTRALTDKTITINQTTDDK